MSRICDWCGKSIRNPRPTQRYHKGECATANHREYNRRYMERYGKAREWARKGNGGAALPAMEYAVALPGWRGMNLWTI